MFVDINGKKHELKLGVNGQCKIEEAIRKQPGHERDTVISVLQNEPGISELRLILWGAMLLADKAATLEDAGILADQIGLARFASQVLPELMAEAYPQKNTGSAGNP
jgi:hypothetical protein